MPLKSGLGLLSQGILQPEHPDHVLEGGTCTLGGTFSGAHGVLVFRERDVAQGMGLKVSQG